MRKHDHTCPACHRHWRHEEPCRLKIGATCNGCLEIRAMEFPKAELMPSVRQVLTRKAA